MPTPTIDDLIIQVNGLDASTRALLLAVSGVNTGLATSVSTAATSSTTATNKAAEASASAASAAASADAALISRNTAQNAADTLAVALASLRQFYLGSFAVDPTVDGNGNPLQNGAEYYNTVSHKLRTYMTGVWADYDATAQAATNNANLSASNAAASEANASTSATSAASSAVAASASATAAAGSASTASTAATGATASASTASNAATAAAASATAAAASLATVAADATAAASSATAAAASATAASGSATTASGAATTATGAASTATTQAGIATSAASAASTSATNAAAAEASITGVLTAASASATAAAASQTSASGSASTATTQAGIATTKALEAAGSVTAAAASQAAAATSAAAAAGSATTAATAAGSATTQATAAAASATAAAAAVSSIGTGVTDTAANATAAAASAAAAAASEAAAAGDATTATTKATAAASDASAAAASATAAGIQASNASVSATSATASASSATASQAAAITQASLAAGSATTATAQAVISTAGATSASASEASALAYKNKAQQWAEETPNVQVETGLYSAKHWAMQAQASSTGSVIYRGLWDASSTIYPGTPHLGDYYIVSVSGTASGIAYTAGQSIIYNASNTWDQVGGSQVVSVNGATGTVVLTKTSVGLGNVDDTSDANKPVSTAQATALALKASISSLATVATTGAYADLTGTPTAYSLPIATATVLGGVKSSSSVLIDGTSGVATATAASVGARASTWVPAWSDVTTKPTTLAGFGITDAYPLTGNPSGFTTNVGTVTGVTATGPVASSGGAAPVISMPVATSLADGYLSSVDWATFNGKQAALGYTPVNTASVGAASGVAPLNTLSVVPTANLPSTDGITEGSTNLFHTLARTLGTVLTGLSLATASAVVAADTLLVGVGKLQAQINTRDASGGYPGMTLMKINFTNTAGTFVSGLGNSNTAARLYTFQDRDGTIADNTDLALKAPLASPTFTGTVGGITAAMVGAPSGSGSSTGTNTGDNSVNTLYSGLVTNATHTGDVTGATALTIAAGAVTYAKMQNVSVASRVLGRITAGAGIVEELTAANLKTILGLTSADVGLGNVANTAQVTSVGGTAPVVSSGGTTPVISMAAASATVNGYLTSTDWATFNGKQPAGTYVTPTTLNNNSLAASFTYMTVGTAALGGTAGNSVLSMLTSNSSGANTDQLQIFDYRFATGSNHGTSQNKIQRVVDGSAYLGYVGFRSDYTSIGWGTTDQLKIDAITGAVTINGGLTNVAGRSFFAATSEPYAVGVRYVSTGGPIYLGATDGTATPGFQISNSAGSSLLSSTNAGAITIPYRLSIGTPTAPTVGLVVYNPTYGSAVGAATYSGDIQINNAQGAINQAGGLEFLSSSYGSGYGTRITSPAISGGLVGCLIQTRSNSATWVDGLSIDMASVSTPLTFAAGATTITGAITATGNITAYYSDDRLKTRLGVIEHALDKIGSLDTFYYEANELAQSLGYKPVREMGLSAQQVQLIAPEVVAPAPIDPQYLTLHYERLVALAFAGIKELRAEVTMLRGGK